MFLCQSWHFLETFFCDVPFLLKWTNEPKLDLEENVALGMDGYVNEI